MGSAKLGGSRTFVLQHASQGIRQDRPIGKFHLTQELCLGRIEIKGVHERWHAIIVYIYWNGKTRRCIGKVEQIGNPVLDAIQQVLVLVFELRKLLFAGQSQGDGLVVQTPKSFGVLQYGSDPDHRRQGEVPILFFARHALQWKLANVDPGLMLMLHVLHKEFATNHQSIGRCRFRIGKLKVQEILHFGKRLETERIFVVDQPFNVALFYRPIVVVGGGRE